MALSFEDWVNQTKAEQEDLQQQIDAGGLPKTFAALKGASKRLEETYKKGQPQPKESDLLAEALIAALPALIGTGLGAAIGKPGLAAAGLAAGGKAGGEALKGLKASEKEQALAQQKLAEEKAARQAGLEKAFIESIARAETIPLREKKGVGVPAGKQLTAEQTKSLADIQGSEDQLSNISAEIEKNKEIMGPVVGRLKTLSPYETESKTFDARMKIAAQDIGKALEGGKLTDADIVRYRQMLPSITDTPEVAAGKLAVIQGLLAQKKAAELETFRQAGYNVSRFFEEKKKQPVGLEKPVAAQPVVSKPDFSRMSDEELKKYLGK